MEHSDMYRYTRDNPAEFAASNTFAEFAAALDGSKPGTGKLLQHIAATYPGTWDNSFLTIKHRGFVGKPLLLPTVTKAAEIFADVSLYPYRSGGHNREDTPDVKAEAAFVSSLRAPGFCYFGRLGAKYEWSPQWLAKGEKVRRVSGGAEWLTGAKPTRIVEKAFGKCGPGDWDLATFEAIQREGGEILIVARCHNGFGSRWLALLDPGETALALMSEHERGEIEAEEARKREAWEL